MGDFSKILVYALAGSMVALPSLASSGGWGLRGERNPQIARQVYDCPATQRDALGRCKGSHRNAMYGRSRRGGGHRYGK